MKISYSWLKQYLETEKTADELSVILTDLGLEVEGVEKIESVKGGLEGLIVGHVVTCEQHPNADRLRVTTVNYGADENIQVVCGAPNVAAGQKVVLAPVGSVLYPADMEKPLKIKKGKIRGEVSLGMLCASDELGLDGDHSGIMILNESSIPGTPLKEVLNVSNDYCIEIGLTPNRADGMSHIGVARDLKVYLDFYAQKYSFELPKVQSNHGESLSEFPVEVTSENCIRYAGVQLDNISIGESPEWLKKHLSTIGIDSINNAVDITNYVLHETGQPLHAFDLAKIDGGKITVRQASEGEKFTTLDEVERSLKQDHLVICDATKPMCIAGVFGGIHSGVSENTNSIYLESAYFKPVSVRKTAKNFGLNTDASFRFERGIDPNTVLWALNRAIDLFIEICGATVSSKPSDYYPAPISNFNFDYNIEKGNALIGKDISKEDILNILGLLEIEIVSDKGNILNISVPPYRVDVQRQVDIVEEIMRVIGYNNIEIPEHFNAAVEHIDGIDPLNIENIVADQLTSLGFHEAMNNSLSKSTYRSLLEENKEENEVAMLNPLSQDLLLMRQSLLPGLLESLSYNINRQQGNIRLYEFGKSYHKYGEGYTENKHLAIVATGNTQNENWLRPVEKVSYFQLKGTVEAVLKRLGLKARTKLKACTDSCFLDGISYYVKKKEVLKIGILKATLTKKFDIKQEVIYAEFNWDNILSLLQEKIQFNDIPKFPAVKRDLALLVQEAVQYSELEKVAKEVDKKLLKEIDLFDVYTGDKLPAGTKSYAMSFVFQNPEMTLTDKIVDQAIRKIYNALETKCQVSLREGSL